MLILSDKVGVSCENVIRRYSIWAPGRFGAFRPSYSDFWMPCVAARARFVLNRSYYGRTRGFVRDAGTDTQTAVLSHIRRRSDCSISLSCPCRHPCACSCLYARALCGHIPCTQVVAALGRLEIVSMWAPNRVANKPRLLSYSSGTLRLHFVPYKDASSHCELRRRSAVAWNLYSFSL